MLGESKCALLTDVCAAYFIYIYMKERIAYIDRLKGFAILLVVIGHVIQFLYCPDKFDDNAVFRFIYSFHMPLFFVLSGWVTNMKLGCIEDLYLKIKSRFFQLVVPFVFWGGAFCRCSLLSKIFSIFLLSQIQVCGSY